MRRVWLRVGLVVAMLGAVVASSYHIFLAEQRIATHRGAERVFNSDAWMLAVALGDLRAAQHAYVSAGQDLNHWMADVGSRFEGVTTHLSALASKATASGAISALDEVAATVAALQRMDVRIREHVLAERPLIASDLIFTDTSEATAEAINQIERARTLERATHQAATAGERRSEGLALAGGAGAIGLVILLLLPAAGAARAETEIAADDAGDSAPDLLEVEPRGAGDLLGLNQGGHSTHDPAPVPDVPTEALAEATAETTAPAPDLRRAADLCTDLVRSSSPADLPALLARAAHLLNASGVIVWVLDGTGDALRPAIGHGYSSTALARIGQLPCDSDNATSAAWRDGRMHVVDSGGAGPHGAIVAPLVSPDGCSGVLSLELNDGWERSEPVQLTVEIVAAQLATLVAADPAGATVRRARA